MAKPGRATQAKREREKSKQAKQLEKKEKRAVRSEQKKERDRVQVEGYDPDLEGIVPGPQPPLDY